VKYKPDTFLLKVSFYTLVLSSGCFGRSR